LLKQEISNEVQLDLPQSNSNPPFHGIQCPLPDTDLINSFWLNLAKHIS